MEGWYQEGGRGGNRRGGVGRGRSGGREREGTVGTECIEGVSCAIGQEEKTGEGGEDIIRGEGAS